MRTNYKCYCRLMKYIKDWISCLWHTVNMFLIFVDVEVVCVFRSIIHLIWHLTDSAGRSRWFVVAAAESPPPSRCSHTWFIHRLSVNTHTRTHNIFCLSEREYWLTLLNGSVTPPAGRIMQLLTLIFQPKLESVYKKHVQVHRIYK